jgi:hypothetical protein
MTSKTNVNYTPQSKVSWADLDDDFYDEEQDPLYKGVRDGTLVVTGSGLREAKPAPLNVSYRHKRGQVIITRGLVEYGIRFEGFQSKDTGPRWGSAQRQGVYNMFVTDQEDSTKYGRQLNDWFGRGDLLVEVAHRLGTPMELVPSKDLTLRMLSTVIEGVYLKYPIVEWRGRPTYNKLGKNLVFTIVRDSCTCNRCRSCDLAQIAFPYLFDGYHGTTRAPEIFNGKGMTHHKKLVSLLTACGARILNIVFGVHVPTPIKPELPLTLPKLPKPGIPGRNARPILHCSGCHLCERCELPSPQGWDFDLARGAFVDMGGVWHTISDGASMGVASSLQMKRLVAILRGIYPDMIIDFCFGSLCVTESMALEEDRDHLSRMLLSRPSCALLFGEGWEIGLALPKRDYSSFDG